MYAHLLGVVRFANRRLRPRQKCLLCLPAAEKQCTRSLSSKSLGCPHSALRAARAGGEGGNPTAHYARGRGRAPRGPDPAGPGAGGARAEGGCGLTPAAAASGEPAASSPRRSGSPAALWSARLACLVWRTGRPPGARPAWGGAARRGPRAAPAQAAAAVAGAPGGPRRRAGSCGASAPRGPPGRRGWGRRRQRSCGCTWRRARR